jgi:hypothetical protein
MKTKIFARYSCGVLASGLLLMAAILVMAPLPSRATGTWQTVTGFPYSNPGHMLLLTDGRVMVQNSGAGPGNGWYGLTPDNHGHYLNGTWTNLSGMAGSRLYYASQVLQNGKVLVAGGEDGGFAKTAEIYDPQTDSWATTPSPLVTISDADSILLPDGKVMVSPVGWSNYAANVTVIYDPIANAWSQGPTNVLYQNEATWVKLPDNSVLTVDIVAGGTSSERYIPSSNSWIPDAPLPVSMAGGKAETGGAFMLADGRAFFLGGSGFTAFYTPSGNTNNGQWTQGPNMPFYSGPTVYADTNNNYQPTNYTGLLTARDTPAAMMNNGRILCQFAAGALHNQVWFYEYHPGTTNFVGAPSPGSTTPGAPYLLGSSGSPVASDDTSMLDLPDGTVLYNDCVNVYIYTPDGSPLPAGKPAILSTSWNADGSLHLAGTLFNGISQGASFGDDAQQDSNYPLVRFTSGSGNVDYGRTHNWSSTGVQTGGQIVTTECKMPASIAGSLATYSLQVVANGNASVPMNFQEPVWVDFNYTVGTEDGSYTQPYDTLAKGTNHVSTGGTIAIKPGSSPETMTIRKPMTITAVGGAVTVGH